MLLKSGSRNRLVIDAGDIVIKIANPFKTAEVFLNTMSKQVRERQISKGWEGASFGSNAYMRSVQTALCLGCYCHGLVAIYEKLHRVDDSLLDECMTLMASPDIVTVKTVKMTEHDRTAGNPPQTLTDVVREFVKTFGAEVRAIPACDLFRKNNRVARSSYFVD